MATDGKQSTFGNVTVKEVETPYPPDCEAHVRDGDEIRSCKNNSTVAIYDYKNEPQFFCKTHCRDTWLEMLNNE